MSEYCEYMWDPMRGHGSTALARSIYEEEARYNKQDKKLAIKTVRAILREMPDVEEAVQSVLGDLKDCTDEYITRFLLARKFRTEQAAALIAAYQAQIAHRQDIFGNLTARDPALQRALRAGIPGVLPARDRKGRCVLVILASQWDPVAVPALSVQRAIFLVLEILIQDPRNQQSGFVAVVDWSGFSLRQGGALGAAALRNLIAALRGRFPARFKAIHFLSAPLYVQATLALVKPFLDEKTRNKIYLHGNNLSTLHQHLPTDILPAELGGTGPAFNPGLWAEPVIHSAMKEAELAAAAREKDSTDRIESVGSEVIQHSFNENSRNVESRVERPQQQENGRKSFSVFGSARNARKSLKDVEMNLISRSTGATASTAASSQVVSEERDQDYKDDSALGKRLIEEQNSNVVEEKLDGQGNRLEQKKTRDKKDSGLVAYLDCQDSNSNEFEIVPGRQDSETSKDSSLDNRSEKAFIKLDNNEALSEKTNLIS